MEIDKNITEVICDLEYKIGYQCYNPNSYNGYTDEEGCEYKYPVQYCKNVKELNEEQWTKTKSKIDNIQPECIGSMRYAFGSNHLYVGDGIVEMLKYLEKRYGLNFNELEDKRVENIKKETEKLKERILNGESIKLSSGKFRIGIEIPEGEYLICSDEKSFFLYNKLQIYNARGTELKPIFLNSMRKKKIKLKDGYVLKAQSSFWISI